MTVPNFSKRGTTGGDAVCLLNYLPSTYPVPIQTGSAQTPAQAVLNTAALPRAGQAVYCNQIVIAFPVGTEAGDIFRQTPAASVNTGKWAMTATEKKKGRELGLDNDINYATFTFDCRDQSDYLINYSLVFGISGAVSPVPSQCIVQVQEQSGTTQDPSTYTYKTCSYTVTTSTPIFYLTNFVATASGSPTVPATEFANGADVNLAWESNGTFFQIYEKGNPKPVYAGTQTAFTLKGGVKTDTTFVLVAMVSGDPGGDQPQTGYQPVYLFDALTVTVSNPVLTPSAVNVSGHAEVGTLGVTGEAEFTNAGVSVLLNVTGATDLADTNVKGSLGVGVPQPQSKLHVNSNDGIRLGLEQNGGGQLVITNNTGDDSIYLEAVSKDGIGKDGKGAAKLLYLGTPGGPNMADLPRLVLHAGSTAVHGSLGVGLGAKLPQNALDVNGGVVIGAGYAGTQKAPDNGLSVQGDVTVEANLTVKQNIDANDLTVNGNILPPSGSLVSVNGPMRVTGQFSAYQPIDMFYPPRNAWFRLTVTKYDWGYFDHSPFTSDSSLKEDVRPIPGALDKVISLRGVLHRWNEKGLHTLTRDVVERVSAGPGATEEQHEAVRQAERQKAVEKLSGDRIGLIAQDVEAALPEAVWENEDGHKCIRYPHLVALLVEAIKEQNAQVQALSGEVSALGERLRDKPDSEWGGGKPTGRELIARLHQTKEDIPKNGISIDATAPVARVVDEIVRQSEADK